MSGIYSKNNRHAEGQEKMIHDEEKNRLMNIQTELIS